ncbi:ABC transporter A family member 8-like [Aristolochia californica]|uniref:ABC transporter A family member 8-like n=1 Tax=Aristolochia californica TaxID=171875 RepID=UPI0035DE704F
MGVKGFQGAAQRCSNFWPGGKDGNIAKYALQALSFALPQGECFGLFGPNGARPTTLLPIAVDESLISVNLVYGGVGDTLAGNYGGGMKRRLSVAISLFGDPKVVSMDAPRTGWDPTSRYDLCNVVKPAKQGRSNILTTHAMEEAAVLCDRLGIIVDGSLQCIGKQS